MSTPTFLIHLDDALGRQLLVSARDQVETCERLDSPAEFFEKLGNGKLPRAIIVTARAADLDPLWFREVKRRSPQSQLLVLARECEEETWRRLLLCGVAGVYRPPWDALDLEAELAAEPAISNLFRRQDAVRAHGKAMFRYSLPSDPKMVVGMVHMVSLLAMEFGFAVADYSMNLPLAVDEALTNAIVHGNGSDRRKVVEVEGLVDATQLRLKIQDEGRGFRREETTDPLNPENLMAPGGRGLFLIESVMDEVRYLQDGRCIEMIKRLQSVR